MQGNNCRLQRFFLTLHSATIKLRYMQIFHKTLVISATALLTAIPAAMGDVTIVDEIMSGGRNIIIQPQALTNLLIKQEVSTEDAAASLSGENAARQRSSGYRVQVFLDNNPSTAKATARSRANAISSRFPELRTYVTYNSPYWRLRVGDFKTQAEAAAAAEDLRLAFPRTAKEIRVVRDNINPAD